eukprot:scaffold1049_cov168-Amphora_coffeaeformis.AAC.16
MRSTRGFPNTRMRGVKEVQEDITIGVGHNQGRMGPVLPCCLQYEDLLKSRGRHNRNGMALGLCEKWGTLDIVALDFDIETIAEISIATQSCLPTTQTK